jgi:outer membrane lipoprotein-sorting protein
MVLRSLYLITWKSIVVFLLSLLSLPACAQDADTILRKCFARYDSARTLQGTLILIIQSYPCPDDNYIKIDFNLSNDKQGRIERYAERRWWKHAEASGVDDDWYPRAAEEARTTPPKEYTVERGKTGFQYYPEKKEYKFYNTKPRKFSKDVLEKYYQYIFMDLPADKKPVVTEITDEGQPAYKILVVRRSRALDLTMVAEVIIDKRTYQLKKLTGNSNVAMISLTFSNQRMNAPLPATLFEWSPPKDYKILPDRFGGVLP